jgi:hypothetical protein
MAWIPWLQNSEPLVDKGPALFWWRLSHRRRFWRMVWISPFYVYLLWLRGTEASAPKHFWALQMFALAMLVGTAVYEYWKWQSEK